MTVTRERPSAGDGAGGDGRDRCSTGSASRARYALVERNGEPVERDRYGDTALEDGDTLVVARPVAGG